MSANAEPQAPPPPPKSSKLPLVSTALIALNLGATVFVTTRVLHGAPAHAAAVAEHGAAAETAGMPRPTVPLEPFLINLNEPGSNRYLKTTLELELADEKMVEVLGRDKRMVRDELLRYLSGLAVADTLGESGKSKIQEAIVARLDKVLGPDKVKRVFFNEFVVQ